MGWFNRLFVATRLVPGAIALGGLLLGAWAWQIHRIRRLDVTGWDIPRLVSHLHARGIPVRIVYTRKDGLTKGNAFLTTTDLPFDAINTLPRGKKYISDWHGVVYCEMVMNPARRADVAIGMDGCSLERDHFVFVGDPQMLGRIAAALRDGG
jgi:hypothetical protein